MSAALDTGLAPGLASTRSKRWPWLLGLGVAIVLAVLGWLVVRNLDLGESPADVSIEQSTDPDGLGAFVALLGSFSAQVEVSTTPLDPGIDVALVLPGTALTDTDLDELEAWHRSSGGVVVWAGSSAMAWSPSRSAWEIPDAEDRGSSPWLTVLRGDRCTVNALVDVDSVVLDPYDPVFDETDIPNSRLCFDGRGIGLLATTSAGAANTSVWLSTISPFTNRLLADGDNAVLATSLFAPVPQTRVAIVAPSGGQLPRAGGGSAGTGGGGPSGGPPQDGPGEAPEIDPGPSLGDLVPLGVRLAALQLLVALALFVWWTARRFGAPVEEPLPVELASSDLVGAVGVLLRRSGSVERAAQLLVDQTRLDLARAVAVGSDAPVEVLAEAIEHRTGRSAMSTVGLLLAPSVADDRGLVELARQLDILRSEVLDGAPA